jgi:hypothetical protein
MPAWHSEELRVFCNSIRASAGDFLFWHLSSLLGGARGRANEHLALSAYIAAHPFDQGASKSEGEPGP